MKTQRRVRARRSEDLLAVIELFRAAVRGIASRDYTPDQVMEQLLR